MKTLAIIPAGGAGRRMGGSVPKQYLPLAGVPVLVHTLRAFQSAPVIDEIYLVVPEADIPEVTKRDRCEARSCQGQQGSRGRSGETGFREKRPAPCAR